MDISSTTEPYNAPFCTFWLAKKRRNCKMRVKQGASYCAEHLTANVRQVAVTDATDTTENGDKRIPCPLDPGHSVYESKLKSHLKKCNARNPEITPSYYSKDLNIEQSSDSESANTTGVVSVPRTTELVERIDRVMERYPNLAFRREGREEELKVTNETEKHRLQQDALSKLILEKVTDKFDKVVVVEFGAGKGGLSSFLWESFFMKNAPNLASEFILIDRSNSRCKKDAKMKHEGAVVDRIFIDIKDLNLQDLLSKYDRERTYFLWISKHLCGAATCLTLNSLTKMSLTSLKGTFCVALCCHQCCTWPAYPNKSFLFESGLIKADGEEDVEKVFKKLCSITSWAVCGFREVDSQELRKKSKLDFDDAKDEISFSDEKKESIGRCMKRLLDHGRELRLKSLIPDCELKHYIEEEVTLENGVLVGHLCNGISK